MTNGMPDVQLGKRPAFRFYGDVAVKLRDHLDPVALPAYPSHQTWGGGIHFEMYLNNSLPDCTCAAVGHAEQVHSTKTGKPEHPTDDFIEELFHQTGIEQNLSDDDGRYMEGVLKHLTNKGLKQADGSYETILGYAAVNPLDHTEVRAAEFIFGGLYFGAALPLSAADQENEGRSWTVVDDPSRSVPGSWGGHAMWSTGFNPRGPRSVTWAHAKQMSWAWWDKYVDEVYAVITTDWSQNVKTPSGFDKTALLQLLQEING